MLEWKTFFCNVDNLEEHLNWCEQKGFEVYEVYPAEDVGGQSPGEGSAFMVIASRATEKPKRMAIVPPKVMNGKISTKSRGSDVPKAEVKTQKSQIVKAQTCK